MACVVRGCSSHKSRQKSNDTFLSFHCFPNDENFKLKWIKLVRPNWIPTKHSRICSIHFTPDSFYATSENQKWRRLKENAVPSLNLSVKGVETLADSMFEGQNTSNIDIIKEEIPEVEIGYSTTTPTPHSHSLLYGPVIKTLADSTFEGQNTSNIDIIKEEISEVETGYSTTTTTPHPHSLLYGPEVENLADRILEGQHFTYNIDITKEEISEVEAGYSISATPPQPCSFQCSPEVLSDISQINSPPKKQFIRTKNFYDEHDDSLDLIERNRMMKELAVQKIRILALEKKLLKAETINKRRLRKINTLTKRVTRNEKRKSELHCVINRLIAEME